MAARQTTKSELIFGVSLSHSRYFHRSNACPECRSYISGTKRIFLNISQRNGDADADDSISETVMVATINGLTEKMAQYETEIMRLEEDHFNFQTGIFVLSMQNDQKKEQLKKLENTARDRKRQLSALQKQLQELEKSAKTQVSYSNKLSAKIMAKDRTIRDLNRAMKTMEAANAKKIESIRTENTKLTDKMTQLNNCIDALKMRTQIDAILNRRVTRSQTKQKTKSKSSARQNKWMSDRRMNVWMNEWIEANSIAIWK